MASSSGTASAMLTGSPRKGIRSPSYSCSFTNAYAGLLPTACSTHYPTQSSNPPPGSKRLTAKPIIPFNRFSISSPPDYVREKSSDQKLKKLIRFQGHAFNPFEATQRGYTQRVVF